MKNNILRTLCAMLIVFGTVFFVGCEKEELETSKKEYLSLDKNMDILELAKKYELDVSVDELDISERSHQVANINELEELFKALKKMQNKKFTYEINATSQEGRQVEISEKISSFKLEDGKAMIPTKRNGPVRIKTGNESSWLFKDHYYHATWMNIYINSSGKVTSSYSGVGLMSYTQNESYSYTSGDTIYFSCYGTESGTVGFENFGIHVSSSIKVTGYIDTNTGSGSMNILTF